MEQKIKVQAQDYRLLCSRLFSIACDKLGGPGKAFINVINSDIFLVFDYIYSFKNVRNNWITVPDKELSFIKKGKTYVARWKDIEALYEEDRKNHIRLTKIT